VAQPVIAWWGAPLLAVTAVACSSSHGGAQDSADGAAGGHSSADATIAGSAGSETLGAGTSSAGSSASGGTSSAGSSASGGTGSAGAPGPGTGGGSGSPGGATASGGEAGAPAAAPACDELTITTSALASTCHGLDGMYVVRPPASTGSTDWSMAAPIHIVFSETDGSCQALVSVEYFDPASYQVYAGEGMLSLVPETGPAAAAAFIDFGYEAYYGVESVTFADPAAGTPNCARVSFVGEDWYLDDGDPIGPTACLADVAQEVPPVTFLLRRLDRVVNGFDFAAGEVAFATAAPVSDPIPLDFPWGTWIVQASRPVVDLAGHLQVVSADTDAPLQAAIKPSTARTWAEIQLSDWLAVNGTSFGVLVDDSLLDSAGEPVAPTRLAGEVVELPAPRSVYEFETANEVWLDGSGWAWIADGTLFSTEDGSSVPGEIVSGHSHLPCQAAGILDVADASTVRFVQDDDWPLDVDLVLSGDEAVQFSAHDSQHCVGDCTSSDCEYLCSLDGASLAAFCAQLQHPGEYGSLYSVSVQ